MDWNAFLISRGACLQVDGQVTFPSRAGPEAPARLAPLPHLGVIRLEGEDASEFLHNQLTSDVRRLAADTAQRGAYCTAKGRMLASFLLWRDGDALMLALAADLAADTAARLSRYVLRSKVKLQDVSERYVLLGLSGPQSRAVLQSALDGLPRHTLGVLRAASASAIELDEQRYFVVSPVDTAPTLWDQLCATAQPTDTAEWRREEIRLGLPWVSAATRELFVPQMANLELIGGVSFQKGCYPGQEVVARSQYLGKVKRRMYRAHLTGNAAPLEGAQLYSPDLPDQPCGAVVNAAAAPEGGFDLLVVVHQACYEGDQVHLDALDGPRLRFESLPYAVT